MEGYVTPGRGFSSRPRLSIKIGRRARRGGSAFRWNSAGGQRPMYFDRARSTIPSLSLGALGRQEIMDVQDRCQALLRRLNNHRVTQG